MRLVSIQSISDLARGSQVNMRTGAVQSEANVTDIHEALHFDVMEERASGYHHSFGIWSLRWGADGREIVAGTGDHSLYVYNMERQKVGSTFCARLSLMDAVPCQKHKGCQTACEERVWQSMTVKHVRQRGSSWLVQILRPQR